MIPLHLSLSGFLSYREPVELDFTTFELACISGSNGAGKSSLLDAITYALFGQARKRDDSLINTHSQIAEVVFTFSYEGNNYRVQRAKQRDKSTLLEFHIQNAEDNWKALTERTLRDTDARIQETLRLDYETFVNASFFLQGKADQFTQQRPADRKRILSNILGLEIWETYRQKSIARRSKIEDKINSLDGRLQEINTELGEEDERKKRLKELTSELARLGTGRETQESVLKELRRRVASVDQQTALVATLKTQLNRAQSQLDESRKRLRERQIEQEDYNKLISRSKEIEAAYAKWQSQREELAAWEEIAGRFHEQEKRRNAPITTIETEKARLESELNSLSVEHANLEERISQKPNIEKELKGVQAEIAKIESQISESVKLEAELKDARNAHTRAQAENPHLKDEMDEIKRRIDQIKKAKGASCPTCGQPLTDEHRQEMVALWTAEGKEKGDRYRGNLVILKEAEQNVLRLEKSIASLSKSDGQLRQQIRTADQLSSNLEELDKLVTTWKKERAPRLKEIEQSLKTDSYAKNARAELKKIDAELKKIGYDAAQHDSLRNAEKKARAVESEMRSLEQAQAALKPLDREIKDLKKQIIEQAQGLAEAEEAHSSATAALATAQSELPDVEAAERQMLELKQSENQLRQEVGAAQQRVAVLADLRERKTEFKAQREELAAQVGQYQSLEHAFGKDGVPAMLIEQALPQIETKANEVLERLSGGNMHINFITQQAYKDKKREDLRETLEIQISDSAGERDYEMFSGGEAFRINFAVRLALSEVLAQRAGARLQTLVIDEGFGSQDEPGRQRLVEAINLVKEDFAKILIITHIDSLKDVFPTRIEVEKTGLGSTIQVI